MAGRGPVPKVGLRSRGKRLRGDWRTAAAGAWVYGSVPAAPAGLLPVSRATWRAWFGSWFAAFWTPGDVPGLRQVIRLYDAVERGEYHRSPELRLQMDTYGITPKGQQDRRWRPPVD